MRRASETGTLQLRHWASDPEKRHQRYAIAVALSTEANDS
jgi:hypothetical protein